MSAKLIVALDVDTFQEAKGLVDRLYPRARFFKVGSRLFVACGPQIIAYIRKKGAGVFLDLKFHDIPNTVAASVAQAARLGVGMLTVHAQGGAEMLLAAKKAAVQTARKLKCPRPRLVAVTVLTSQASKDARKRVLALAKLSRRAGLDGVVCSAREAAAVRKACGKNFIIVTPGIRPNGAGRDDQKRTATVDEAIAAGSDYLVVGRPIVAAADPKATVLDFIR